MTGSNFPRFSGIEPVRPERLVSDAKWDKGVAEARRRAQEAPCAGCRTCATGVKPMGLRGCDGLCQFCGHGQCLRTTVGHGPRP